MRREDVDLVRERTRIDEVIGQQVTLKGAGSGSLKGLCPFHDERSPSFTVRPAVGLYHCFGCGEGGDVFSFVQKVDGVGFLEAVERLAGAAGITLRYEEGGRGGPREDVGRRSRLIDAHAVAAELYVEALASPEAEVARRFLVERGFDRSAAQRFGVGFAPSGWDVLTRHLRGRGFTDEEIVLGGLGAPGRSASRGPYDRFRGRLVWPIRDTTGATIGFGARRLLEADQGPKYLNTPETPLYRKSHVLYGLDLAKKAIAAQRRVVVVEGYTDVMACHLAGVGTAVATCGTAFGADHVSVVRRFLGDDGSAGGEVVYTFDGDAAGRKAALRAYESDQRFTARTWIAVEPDGRDPCELRVERGDAAVAALVASRRPLFEFAITSALADHDLERAEGRVAALREAAPLVESIKDRTLRAEYARRLAGWLGMDVDEVRRAVAAAAPRPGSGGSGGGRGSGPAERAGAVREGRDGADAGAGPRGGAGPGGGGTGTVGGSAAASVRSSDPQVDAERQLLQIMVQAPHLAPLGTDDLPEDAFATPSHRAVHGVVRSLGGMAAAAQVGASWPERVREGAGEDLAPLVHALAVAPLRGEGEAAQRTPAELVTGMVAKGMERREKELSSRMQRLYSAGDTDGATVIFRELTELTARRQALLAG